jgi:hypothetical protein
MQEEAKKGAGAAAATTGAKGVDEPAKKELVGALFREKKPVRRQRLQIVLVRATLPPQLIAV